MENLRLLSLKPDGNFGPEDNYLANLPNLEIFRITVLIAQILHNEAFFQANLKLREVYVDRFLTPELIPWNLFKNNLLLEKVSLVLYAGQLDERMFETNENLTNVYLTGGIHLLPRNLFKNNLLLESVEIFFASLQKIDERIFETNLKLKRVNIRFNDLTHLPRDLFKNNLELEYINFQSNKLQIIEIDFSALKNVQSIDLSENRCINKEFSKRPANFKISDLELFSNFVDAGCR